MRARAITVCLLLTAGARMSAAQEHPASYVTETANPQRFTLAFGGSVPPIIVSARDLAGVRRAASDLRADLGRVTGVEPELLVDAAGPARHAIIIGTLGHHPLIDDMVRRGRLDVRGISGRWETSLIQVVDRPAPGINRALVIAGSDRRGTIYGIYDLSAEIGVSPWYWWADVPVRRRTSLYVEPGRHTRGEPAVKYRGIFLNDEAPALSGWARMTFGGFNHQFYEKVFELLLRLRGNYLWPAMWGNAFADDDTASARIADEYGVVMGTSHHEPLTRAQAEWRKYGKGEWNYEHNDSVLRAFWRGGIERMGTRENIVTLGMRGDGDMPMTEGSNIALLERIVADQRKIITDVTRRPARETPQLWALYKEVQDYHDKGMRVPDDVTLLFADDNWGNIRRLPSAADRDRPGGFGVYYHFDYVGGPRNYKWLNTNPIARVWEQMHLAWRHGADRIWIVNVGDLKPMEYPISFFLDYAWDPSRYPAERLSEYPRMWARQQFGESLAAPVATLVTDYLFLAGRRKPEMLAPETYSLTSWNEWPRVMAAWDSLDASAKSLRARVPAAAMDAYYQLVQHPIEAQANLHRLYYATARNRLAFQQGRASTKALGDSVRGYFDRDEAITRYFHSELANGKWNHMMAQTHIGYTYWQEPPRNAMPRVDVIQVPSISELGVAYEGQASSGPPGPGGFRPPTLPELDPSGNGTSWIDVFARGSRPVDFTVEASAPWLHVEPASGRLGADQRLTVSVDWPRVSDGRQRAAVTVAGSDGRRFVLQVPVFKTSLPAGSFVQSRGVVAIEAEHYTSATSGPSRDFRWLTVPGLGRTLSGVTATPVTMASVTPGASSPSLSYRVVLVDSGDVTLRTHVSPTFNFLGRKEGLRFAVSIDDEAPRIVDVNVDSTLQTWERAVGENIRVLTTHHRVARPGVHTVKFWLVDPGVVLQRLILETREVAPSYLGPPESKR